MNKKLAILAVVCISACMVGQCRGTEAQTELLKGLSLIQMQTGYVVDDVLAFLKSFETDISYQVTHLDEAVRVESEYLEGLLKELETLRRQKQGECATKQSETEEVIKEYTKQTDLVNWITKRITDNYEKIDEYHKKSCQQTLDFVEYLRNAQNALNLIKFLRQGLTNYSFAQMKSIASVVNQYSQDTLFFSTSNGLQLMLLQLEATLHQVDSNKYHSGDSLNDRVRDRNSDEIGHGHVDNNKGNIDLDEFDGAGRRMGLEAIKKELFAILDALEKKIQESMNQKINSMITLGETTAEYIITLEREIEYLEKELTTQLTILREVELRVKDAQDGVEKCQSEYDELVEKIRATKEKHDKYINDRANYRQILLDQLAQLIAIIKIYEAQIATTAEGFKQRYDDVLDNDKVDYTAHVDDRQLKIQYDNLQDATDLGNSVNDDIVQTPVPGPGVDE